MSWAFGVINKGLLKYSFHNLEIKSLLKIKSDDFIIFCGGTTGTLLSKLDEEKKTGWIVLGIGIYSSNYAYRILNEEDWNTIISNNSFNDISGHYIIIHWNNSKISFYTDPLGLRDIYFYQNKEEIVFSTRIDWIGKYSKSDIDYSTMGSRWLLINQIELKSPLQNSKRVTAGKIATVEFQDKIVSVEDYDCQPKLFTLQINNPIEQFREIFQGIINSPVASGKKLSLSLSGGLDSRFILSFLVNSMDKNVWDTHTFGLENHPDSFMARKITEDFKITHHQLNRNIPNVEDCIDELKDYMGKTTINNSASAVLQMNNYLLLKPNDFIVIDGGYGEIWRREFFNRFLFKGKDILLNKEPHKIFRYLQMFRADIFSDEIFEIMYNGSIQEIDNVFNLFPDIHKIGIENWIDLFAIKIRLPNYFGSEQARVDEIVPNLMPFIQKPLLELLFSFDLSHRNNGKFFRKILRDNNSRLTKYRLVKGDFIHPFRLTSLQSRLWVKASRKLGKKKKRVNTAIHFLEHIKEFVFDSINSQEFLQYQFYNHNKINSIVEEFYKGNFSYTNQLDWFISFEAFRQAINERNNLFC